MLMMWCDAMRCIESDDIYYLRLSFGSQSQPPSFQTYTHTHIHTYTHTNTHTHTYKHNTHTSQLTKHEFSFYPPSNNTIKIKLVISNQYICFAVHMHSGLGNFPVPNFRARDREACPVLKKHLHVITCLQAFYFFDTVCPTHVGILIYTDTTKFDWTVSFFLLFFSYPQSRTSLKKTVELTGSSLHNTTNNVEHPWKKRWS